MNIKTLAAFVFLSASACFFVKAQKLPKNNLDLGINYTSDYNVFGTVNANAVQPSAVFSVDYFRDCGLYLGTRYNNIWNSDTTLTESTSELNFIAGYTHSFFKGVSFAGSYTYMHYSSKSSTAKTDFHSDIMTSLSLDTTWLYSSFTADYLIGKDKNEWVLNYRLGIPVNLNLSDNVTLLVQPYGEINWGNQSYYYQWAYRQYKFLIPLAVNMPDVTAYELLQPINKTDANELKVYKRLISRYKYLEKKVKKLDPSITVKELFKPYNKYNITSVGGTLPLYLNWNNMSFSFSVTAIKPQNVPSWMKDDWVFYYNAGLTYSIGW
jgi:hypothetical protein